MPADIAAQIDRLQFEIAALRRQVSEWSASCPHPILSFLCHAPSAPEMPLAPGGG